MTSEQLNAAKNAYHYAQLAADVDSVCTIRSLSTPGPANRDAGTDLALACFVLALANESAAVARLRSRLILPGRSLEEVRDGASWLADAIQSECRRLGVDARSGELLCECGRAEGEHGHCASAARLAAPASPQPN
ncbi:MAG TPA: hypothetical protein VMK42_09345 [Anaeromyxobacteraceae bacterium]|nr:hypothetical protein [Anaeromyxobacteraceae bacterium]